MSKVEKIQTLHPNKDKVGVNISRQKYDTIKEFILSVIDEKIVISYEDINDRAEQTLRDTFDGSVPWYVVTVKLDLEARGIIERVKGKGPHKVKRV